MFNSDELALTSSLTLEFWILCSSLPSDAEAFVIGRHTAAPRDQKYFVTVRSDGLISFQIENDPFAHELLGPGCPTDCPQHIACTYDGSMMRIFVNGVEANSRVAAFDIQSTEGGSLRIGADFDDTGAN